MSYLLESRVRYSETDAEGNLSLLGVLNYFQDCCIFHSSDVGKGVEAAQETHQGWVLASWQIVVERYPRFGEALQVKTWPYDFRGFLGSRNFTMETEQGERLAYANSLWSFVDTRTGHPMKLTEEDTKAYVLEEKLEMEYAPRKITLPAGMEEREPIVVKPYHVDTNHHVNNGQYVLMTEAFLPEGFAARQLRVEYKQQARLGDVIYPKVGIEGAVCTVALNDGDGRPYCVAEFCAG